MRKFYNLFWIIFCVFLVNVATAQVTVTSSIGRTAEDIVRSTLVGSGVSVSNVTFNNVSTALDATSGGQLGIFTNNINGFPALGFTNGLIIATGDVSVAMGPNDDAGAESTVYNSTYCSELQTLIYETLYYPAVLEFDFVTTSDQVTFNYVFASEEYPEFVNAGYNDVFGFFVTDLTTNQTRNVALIPGTNLPVSIDNVNDYSYSQYYHATPDYSYNTEYDACVGPFAATFSVVPCRMYHMKLAISNAGDDNYGSAVFLQGQSFTAEGTESSVVYDNESLPIVVQDCNTATVTFNLANPLNSPTVIPLTYSGTAVNGVDVSALPASVTIPAGETSVSIVVRAIGDYTPDTLQLNIYYENTMCADGTTITILVCKNEGIEISADDILFCQAVDSLNVHLISGSCGDVEWTPSDMLSNPNSLNTGFLTEYLTTTQFTVTAHDIFHCTSSTTTFDFRKVDAFNDTIQASICEGQTYSLNGFNENETGVYTNFGTSAFGCDSNMTLILNVYSAEAEILVGETDVCEEGYVDLTAITNTANFHWNTGSSETVLHVTRPGNYSITAVDGPCTAQDLVVIDACPDEDIYAPNAITPSNDDGVNDEFQVYIPASLDIQEFEISIYDRWGRLVFQSNDPHFHWDGSHNGKTLVNSTFVWRISILTAWHPLKVYKGSLTVF